ncbi:zinc finger BED domain-containing protein RICESLEEPER 2 [Tanacetum coccineum]
MTTQSSSTTTGVGSSSAPTVSQILTTTRNPEIWQHYNLCKMSDNSTKAQCKHCFTFLSSGSNSTLKNHIMHPHCEALKTVPEAGQSSMAQDGSVFVYNPDVLCEHFAGLVIQQGLPFNHFDNGQMTRVFQNHMQPKHNHVSRTTLKRDAVKLWKAAKLLIIDELLIESILTDLECFDDDFATKAKQWFKDSLEGFYNIYYTKYGNPTQSTSAASSSRSYSGNPMTNLLNKLKENKHKRARNDRLTSSEYERYVDEDFISHLEPHEFAGFDVLGFWKAKESMFPILSRMAMDLISVQATLVASESAFSTIGRVLSIRRIRLTPASLEMCMCLKDHMDATEPTPLSDEEIALDQAASEARSNESGFRGEEFDMTLPD